MGSLISARVVVARAIASAMTPPPPPDLTRWCEENLYFDERSAMPGPFRIDRFPFLRKIHEVLSPEHPSREVTIRGSAQWGKTESVMHAIIGAWHSYKALDSLIVHPTTTAATEWSRRKFGPLRRSSPSLRRIFGRGSKTADTLMNIETADRTGSLKVTSSGSPSDLTGTTRPLVIMDDLSKFEMNAKGDPEELAASRASSFEDGCKIVRISTAMIAGTCRISLAFDRSDQRLFDVPCPHCGQMQALEWENFVKNIDPENLSAAHFSCIRCQVGIEHKHKGEIVGKGRWERRNPKGDHPGFHLWRAYAPQRDWASIAADYARTMGWSRAGSIETGGETVVQSETEQTFWNDVLGLPYSMATGGLDWKTIQARAENPESEALDRGVVPPGGVILTAGVDCQEDRVELHVKAFGANRRSWTVDYVVIPYPITDPECGKALDAYLDKTWATQAGFRIGLDMLAIDEGSYQDAVRDWAYRHPWSRVITVRGGRSATAQTLIPMQFRIKSDGRKARRARGQKASWMVNVSQLKVDFYTFLTIEDPDVRGFCSFARGLGDDFYRQACSEKRITARDRYGVLQSKWVLVEPSRRNEVLDTNNYATAAALRKGWMSMTDGQWDALEARQSEIPKGDQPDLFEAAVPAVAAEKTAEIKHPATAEKWTLAR